MSDQHDVIVVGARCAGSPLAMLLARKGHRVLLVDKQRFPSDTMSTHYIQFGGVSYLRRWGLEKQVADTNCPAITTMTVDFGPFALSGRPVASDGTDVGYAPRRRLLDQLLIEAAVEAGAEFREAFAVEELISEDGRVSGIVGSSADGRRASCRSTVVVGADGLWSTVAKLVHAPLTIDRGTLACVYYTYWSGVPATGFAAYVRDRCAFGVFPTNDGLTCIPVGWPRAMFDEVRHDYEAAYHAALAQAPDVASRVAEGRREERFVGTGRLPNQFRKSWGPGWALVGDAAHHKDPGTARGITDAFAHVDLLAEVLDQALAGECSVDDALAAYEKRRDAEAMPFSSSIAGWRPSNHRRPKLRPCWRRSMPARRPRPNSSDCSRGRRGWRSSSHRPTSTSCCRRRRRERPHDQAAQGRRGFHDRGATASARRRAELPDQ